MLCRCEWAWCRADDGTATMPTLPEATVLRLSVFFAEAGGPPGRSGVRYSGCYVAWHEHGAVEGTVAEAMLCMA